MPHARWFVLAFLLAVALVAGFLNSRGPFGDHPAIAYDQVFKDYTAGRVEKISHWRDQLEIVEVDGSVVRAVIPPDRDFARDFEEARRTSMNGIHYSRLPDAWLGVLTPWVPAVVALAALLIWSTAIMRNGKKPAWSSVRGHDGIT